MQAVLTVLGALHRQRAQRGGCFIDISMAESLLQWNAISFNAPMRRARAAERRRAFYQIYATADGRFVTLSPLEPKFWDNFCNAVGRPEWIPRRYEPLPQTALIAEVAGLFASRSLAEWDAILSPTAATRLCSIFRKYRSIRRCAPRRMIERRTFHATAVFPAFIDESAVIPHSAPGAVDRSGSGALGGLLGPSRPQRRIAASEMLRPGGGGQVRSPMIRVRPGPRNGVATAASPGSMSERTFGIPSPSRTRCSVTSRQALQRLISTSSGSSRTHSGSAARLSKGTLAATTVESRAGREEHTLEHAAIMPLLRLRNGNSRRNLRAGRATLR